MSWRKGRRAGPLPRRDWVPGGAGRGGGGGAGGGVAARRGGALLERAAECESLGGRALAVPTDVADLEAVEELARRAIEHFGGFDVWVNNASVTMFSRFEEAPPEANRRVIETNLLGTRPGGPAALAPFPARGGAVR